MFKYDNINISISLCIPTMNRFDKFLSLYLDEYVKYLKDGLINEIIISDENGNDYEEIYNKYHEIINDKNNYNFKIYKNENVLGVFLNKLKVCSYSSNEYIALIDSDNFANNLYFLKIREYILKTKLPNNFVLSPCESYPHFNYRGFENKIITKDLYS